MTYANAFTLFQLLLIHTFLSAVQSFNLTDHRDENNENNENNVFPPYPLVNYSGT